ncbi:TrbI/VirB10 family protein [Leptothoe sp. EHU-05/26/07-4]
MSDLHQDAAYREMAQLVNFDQSTAAEPDNGNGAFHHPEDEPSPRRFSQMGSTKLLFVAGGVSVVALLVGLITNQIFRPVTVTTNEPTETTYEADDQLTLSLEPPTHDEKGELGELRTEVALKDQAQDLQDLDGDPLTEADDAPSNNSSDEETSSTDTVTRAAPQPAPAVPRPAPVQPAPVQPMPQSQPAVQIAPEPIGPWEQWQQFALSGTLGQVQFVAHTQPNAQPTARPNTTNRTPQPTITRQSQTTIGPARTVSPGTAAPQQPVVRVPAPETNTPAVAQTPESSLGTYVNGYTPIPGMRHPTTQTIPVGTTVTATVTTPILWPGDGSQVTNSRSPDTPKYIVTLDAPLMTADERIVFPRAAQLVVTVAPMDTESGVATLDVLAILRDDQSYSIPNGHLHIRGKDGNPLVADRFNDPGGAIFSMDAGLFVISGLANLGTILNRPRSSTVINSDFQGTIATEYDDPNFLGAVLEGGAGALAERLADRNDQAIEDLAERPSTWYLPAGTPVQLFVNQPMQI